MILTVDHVTTYRYSAPVRAMVQSHRLTPAQFDGQKVLSWEVAVTEGTPGGAFRDGAGDLIQGWTVVGPIAEITVTVRGRVDTFDTAGVLRGHRATVNPCCYLRDTMRTRMDAALADLAAPVLDEVGPDDPLTRAHRLSAAVSDAILWQPGATQVQTTAAEALTRGAGVCQDHAHALIALARHAGLPARYVAGYMFTGDQPGEAAHAWTEIHIRGLGWVGFDPANRCCPDARYVRLGSGLDAQDAAPIRGIARGGADESMDVAVAVRAAQQ
ncbi:MAG: transglutaminase family protein [Rhodobacterales bacterium]|nr:transglutaminase family protein [Rhodobacterales bacterium]